MSQPRNRSIRILLAVFEVLSKLPKHGVGAKVTRTSWKEGSYWHVTNVKVSLVSPTHI